MRFVVGVRGIAGIAQTAAPGVIGRELLGRLPHAEVARGKFLRHAPGKGAGGCVVVICRYTLSWISMHARHTLPCAHRHPSSAMCLRQTSHLGAIHRSMVKRTGALLPNVCPATSPPMAENTAADRSMQSAHTACRCVMGLQSARPHTLHTPARPPLAQPQYTALRPILCTWCILSRNRPPYERTAEMSTCRARANADRYNDNADDNPTAIRDLRYYFRCSPLANVVAPVPDAPGG